MKTEKNVEKLEWERMPNREAFRGWLSGQRETTLFIIHRTEHKPEYKLGGAFVPDADERTMVYTIESAKKAAEEYLRNWMARNVQTISDTDRLNYLERFLQSVDSGIIAFNDDPDIECDDSESGFLPVGFRIASTGCHGTLTNLGRTLREAIDAAIVCEEPK